MNKEILSRKSQETMTDFEEEVYEVNLTGATVSSTSSVSLLHRYCSKLPHDEYALKTQYILTQFYNQETSWMIHSLKLCLC